jgi:hypothetical protein
MLLSGSTNISGGMNLTGSLVVQSGAVFVNVNGTNPTITIDGDFVNHGDIQRNYYYWGYGINLRTSRHFDNDGKGVNLASFISFWQPVPGSSRYYVTSNVAGDIDTEIVTQPQYNILSSINKKMTIDAFDASGKQI